MAALDIPNPELYHILKHWRDKICEEQNLPIYIVANSASLKDICTYLPLTNQQLQLLSGFGKAKADKYGGEIISMVEAYCNQYGLESNMELKVASPKKQRKEPSVKKEDKIPSRDISLKYFKEGKSIQEIAKERILGTSTIEEHLTYFIKTGQVKIDAFADETSLKIISQYITTNPEKTHGEIRIMLNNAYSYTQIRAVANHLLWLQNKTTPQTFQVG